MEANDQLVEAGRLLSQGGLSPLYVSLLEALRELQAAQVDLTGRAASELRDVTAGEQRAFAAEVDNVMRQVPAYERKVRALISQMGSIARRAEACRKDAAEIEAHVVAAAAPRRAVGGEETESDEEDGGDGGDSDGSEHALP